MRRGVYKSAQCPSVRPSVCLSHSPAAAACCGFAAIGQASKGHRLIATACVRPNAGSATLSAYTYVAVVMLICRLLWVCYQQISNCCRPVSTYWLTDWRHQWLTDCWSCRLRHFGATSFSLLHILKCLMSCGVKCNAVILCCTGIATDVILCVGVSDYPCFFQCFHAAGCEPGRASGL